MVLAFVENVDAVPDNGNSCLATLYVRHSILAILNVLFLTFFEVVVEKISKSKKHLLIHTVSSK